MSKYSVKWDNDKYEYVSKTKIGKQTFCMAFQENDITDDWQDCLSYNVCISLYNKRSSANDNEDKKLMTGLNPLRTFCVAREMFQEIERTVVEDNWSRKLDTVIYCSWVDNRRRDAYYKVLSRWGYTYGKVNGKKVIMKKFNTKDMTYMEMCKKYFL